jgi:phosphoribosylaminoimidazolecarboxamide formyltransferase/IMP cyclohydrolase
VNRWSVPDAGFISYTGEPTNLSRTDSEGQIQVEYKQVKRALLSVTDKTGLVDFARQLSGMNVELISTGGTARVLRDVGLKVRDISDLTGFPEMLDGRVKTLHPKVHGGILHIRSSAEHQAAVAEQGIESIDMVVVNLYAFEETARKPGVSFGELVENIDIGGPSMLRSAAKNFEDVAVVTSAADYEQLAAEMQAHQGGLSLETRWRLARQAFTLTAGYDSAIARTFNKIAAERQNGTGSAAGDTKVESSSQFPSTLLLAYAKTTDLRYGENPHQGAALYGDGTETGIAGAQQLQGKELSYNNLVDLDAAWELVNEFAEPAVAIIKHSNPAGMAVAATVAEAYLKSLATDPVSAFGSVIGVNREVDDALAEEISKLFVEAIAAPSFSEGARTKFSTKKNLRLLTVKTAASAKVIKQISGGLLLQDADKEDAQASELKVVTVRQPSADEMEALLFAWKVAKHVKSNAIVYARDGQTLGVGAGQMSRVDAAKFGAMKAVLPLANCVVASDAFFPFPDGLEAVAAAGATAVIQPGGSMRDQEVIDAANRLNLAMVFTGFRHFRH